MVSGHKDALDEVQKLATTKGALKATPLAVSGAFHTPLMQPAREALIKVCTICPADHVVKLEDGAIPDLMPV